MRRLLLIVLVVTAPVIAAAKPSVAVLPLDGDTGNKVGNAVAKAAEDEASSVTGPKETGKAMDKLGLSGELDKKDQKKLRGKLEVEILIQGKVEKDDGEKSLELKIAGKGIKTAKLKLRFKSATTSSFRNELREALAKRLAPGESEEDEEDRPRRLNDDDRPKKPKSDDEDRPKKPKSDDEDQPKKPKRVARPDQGDEDEEDGGSVRKKKKRRRSDDDEAETPRHAVTQVAIRLNAGAGFGRRGLTYDGGMASPPSVGTASPSGRIEVEAYPGAMSTLKGAAAGIGVYGDYDMSFGVGIAVPGSGGKTASIAQSHYAIGARYRIPFGEHAVAFGVGYTARKYTADRSGLGMVVLDMPDVSYRAISPNVVGRFAATPTIGIFVSGAFLFLLDAGPIATNANFGYAKTLAFEGAGGADIMLTKGYGLRIAAELSQVGFEFKNSVRSVKGATDRTIGAIASFEVLY
ncbi:MAG: hypothetical protein IPQ07_36400 [Myxococcales bacterium]|nr:hypothetical protein [Myxococcales bacterium]